MLLTRGPIRNVEHYLYLTPVNTILFTFLLGQRIYEKSSFWTWCMSIPLMNRKCQKKLTLHLNINLRG